VKNLRPVLLILAVCIAGFLFLRPNAAQKKPIISMAASTQVASMKDAELPAVENTSSNVPAASSNVCSECGQIHPGFVCAMYGGRSLMTLSDLPEGNVKSSVAKLPAEAQQKALLQLSRMNFRSMDEESVRVDSGGAIYYVCNFTGPGMPEAEQAQFAEIAASSEPVVAAAVIPVTTPPIYHSKLGSTNVLFLDFNGADISNTMWNASYGVSVWHCLPFNRNGSDGSTFDDTEQRYIREIWERVSEDYAVFDVDVTTEEPVVWTRNTAHALITATNDANGVACPHAGWGGVAYPSIFGKPENTYKSPAWITPQSPSNYSATAEAASHELGHNLGLNHDGEGTNEYYWGHAGGSISWAPIMGAAYGKTVTQWSKGEYYNANRFEDDLTILATKLKYKPDDYGNARAQAASVMTSGGVFSVTGIVERTDDSDMFSFTCIGGTLVLTGATYRCSEGPWGGNGDLVLTLYDSVGAILASNNPPSETKAVITQTVAGGTYYVKISPTGVGNPTNNPPTGYTSYGSIGPYTIAGSVPLPDRDTDGIPDNWETQYFGGATNANPTATVSNGVNTVLQCYIAGLNPTSAASFFKVTGLENDGAGNGFIVRWSAVSGRVYSVYSVSNLLNNFQGLATNIAFPQSSYTDSVYQAGQFYKIDVRLAP
jgi:hypothetical protein